CTNNARGQIVVTKITTGGNGSITFTHATGPQTGTPPSSITTSGGTGTSTFSNLAPSPTASYTVSEAANASFSAVGPTSCVTTVKIGRASCRERINVAVGSVAVTKNTGDGTCRLTYDLSNS